MPIAPRLADKDEAQASGTFNKANQVDVYISVRDNPVLLYDVSGHEIVIDATNEDEAIPIPVVKKVNGRWVVVDEYDESNVITSQDITITLPSARLYSYFTQGARRAANCLCLWEVPTCPDTCSERYLVHDLSLNPPRRDRITGFDGDAKLVTTTVTGRITNSREFYLLNNQEFTLASSDIIEKEAFVLDNCTDCDYCTALNSGWRTGTDGLALLLQSTDDRFATNTPAVLAAAITTTNIGVSLYADNDLVIVGTADNRDSSAATTGELLVSFDGSSFVQAIDATGTPLVGAFFTVVNAGDYYFAGGLGQYATSQDGRVWEVTSLSVATDVITDAAYDSSTRNTYIAAHTALGADGKAFILLPSGQLIEITAEVGGVTLPTLLAAPLYTVSAGGDHVRFGGGGFWYAENFSASNRTDYTVLLNSGIATDIIYDIADTNLKGFDMFIVDTATGGQIWLRTPVTAQNFRVVDVDVAFTGVPIDITEVLYDDGTPQAFRILFDDGSLLELTDCLPDLC